MPAARSFRVFLSAVSADLGEHRLALARALRRLGLTVDDQAHFSQGDATLLQRLEEYVVGADLVILLVGHEPGAYPQPAQVVRLGDRPIYRQWLIDSGQTAASYTQWEYLFARHHGKRMYRFLTAAPDATAQPAQAAWHRWLRGQGDHYDALADIPKLIEDVLVLDLPHLARPIPIALPFQSLGHLFKGRDAMLTTLRDSLGAGGDGRATAIVGQAVHGLGGVGKTRLAVEYAWRHVDSYRALLFVVAETPEALVRNLAGLAGPAALDLDLPAEATPDVQAGEVLRWLQANPGWLLILDNLDSEAAAGAAEGLLARLHGGHVLLTGRLANWSAQVRALPLDVLDPEPARDFLLERTAARRRPAADDPALATAIAAELGHLALALEHAGAYIAQRRLGLAGYRDEWRRRQGEVMAWFDARAMQYPGSLAVTWQTSVDQLGAPARLLLQRLAWFAPEPIPETLLAVRVADDALADPEAALAELETYSLVQRDPDAPQFSVHRLVQDVTRRSLDAASARARLHEALDWLRAAFVGEAQDVRDWPVLEPLAVHVAAVCAAGDGQGIEVPTAGLLRGLGVLYWAQARHREAEAVMRRALEINGAHFGKEHPELAIDLNNLAQLLKTTNQLAEAEPLMRRALEINEASYGESHPKVATHLNNLAALLMATNRLAEAEPLMRRALVIDEASYGESHPRVAIDLNNLAQLLATTNRLAEAEPLMRRALVIDEASYGESHPRVATDLNNLARLLQATTRLEEAEPLMRRALAIDEASYGTSHPEVATDLNNLAQLLQDMNRLVEAEPLMRRALAIDEASYGALQPEVARDLNNLAGLLQATNRLAQAEPLMRRALAILEGFERDTGFEHPNTRAARANLAVLLAALGRAD
ncbi:MAG: tetratricopeptide repeat protein [Chromatiales bacterium]|nr:tetratricopeptide repeat protein [Gammaproteobacteria bacterium]MCP5352908.1 tetratricopeptide repeat protein [Chromatiales bacterium]